MSIEWYNCSDKRWSLIKSYLNTMILSNPKINIIYSTIYRKSLEEIAFRSCQVPLVYNMIDKKLYVYATSSGRAGDKVPLDVLLELEKTITKWYDNYIV